MVDFLSDVRLRILGTRSTLAELAGINTTILKDGALVYVSAAQDVYCLLKESTQAPDGINIVQSATGSPGRWFAVGIAAQANVYAAQSDWYVDEQDVSGNASDSNVGDTAAAPLASYAELTRRIEFATLEQDTTVHLLSDVADDSVFIFRGSVATTALLSIVGETPTVLDTLTSVAAQNLVIDSDRPYVQLGAAWNAALVGQRCRITASTGATQIGALFWLEEIDGVDPTICYISQPYFIAAPPNFGSAQNLAVGGGDTFVVEQLVSAGLLNLIGTGGSDITLSGLHPSVLLENLRGPDLLGPVLSLGQTGGNFQTQAYGCQISWSLVQGAGMLFSACRLGGSAATGLQYIGMPGGYNAVDSCSLHKVGAGAFFQFVGRWSFFNDSSFMNARLLLGTSVWGGIGDSFVQASGALSFWQWATAAIELRTGAYLELTGVAWGTSTVANTRGFDVETGAHAEYSSGSPPTVSGTLANDIIIGGAQATYAGLPAAGQNPNNNNAWLVASA